MKMHDAVGKNLEKRNQPGFEDQTTQLWKVWYLFSHLGGLAGLEKNGPHGMKCERELPNFVLVFLPAPFML